MLYNSFIYPHFTYCLSVWGNTCKSYLSPIISLQDRAVRLISGAKKGHDMPVLYEKHKLLDFTQIYLYSVQCFMFKYHHDKLPKVFDKFLFEIQIFMNETQNLDLYFMSPYVTVKLVVFQYISLVSNVIITSMIN